MQSKYLYSVMVMENSLLISISQKFHVLKHVASEQGKIWDSGNTESTSSCKDCSFPVADLVSKQRR